MTERIPTAAEQRKWNEFVILTDRVGRRILANSARSMNCRTITAFCTSRNIPVSDVSDLDARLTQLANEWRRIKKAIDYVHNYDLGVRITNGNIDIVAPANYTAEQIAAMGLSGWFLPILVGILVISGVGIKMLSLWEENDNLKNEYDTMIKASERRICEDPDSADCVAWKREKDETEYNKNKTLIDDIEESLTSVGTTIKKGLGVGALLAIPLLVFLVARK